MGNVTLKSKPRGNPNAAEVSAPYRWKPGQSGNPKGAPKGPRKLAQLMRKQLHEPASVCPPVKVIADELGLDPEHTTIGSVLTMRLILDGMNGNGPIAKEILNRIDGVLKDALSGLDEEESIPLTHDELEVRVRRALERQVK